MSLATSQTNIDWRPGYCAPTQFTSRPPDCQTDVSGAWAVVRSNADEQAQRRRCAARCSRCAQCRYVSFSSKWADCSWFHECNYTKLRRDLPAGGHVTARVEQHAPSGHRSHQHQQRRRNATRLQHPPHMLLVYHMAKTGGTALISLTNGYVARALDAKKQRASGGLSTSKASGAAVRSRRSYPVTFEKGTHGCVALLFPRVFDDVVARMSANDRTHCAGAHPTLALGSRSWRDVDIVVEFHGAGQHEYWSVFEPKLPELRLAYAAVGGAVITTTATREPLTLIRSTYKMWPPRMPAAQAEAVGDGRPIARERGQRVGLMSFAEVLNPAPGMERGLLTGLLARQLLLSAGKGVEWSQMNDLKSHSAFNCSSDAIGEARRRLASFDVVGTTECTRRYWQALDARIPNSLFGDAEVVAATTERGTNLWYKPGEPNLAFRDWAAATADDELDARGRAALRAAAACDAPLHLDGMRLAGVLPASIPDQAPELANADDVRERWLQAAALQPNCGLAEG